MKEVFFLYQRQIRKHTIHDWWSYMVDWLWYSSWPNFTWIFQCWSKLGCTNNLSILLRSMSDHTQDIWTNVKYSNMISSNQNLVRQEFTNQEWERSVTLFTALLLFLSKLSYWCTLQYTHVFTWKLTADEFLCFMISGRGCANVHWPIRNYHVIAHPIFMTSKSVLCNPIR